MIYPAYRSFLPRFYGSYAIGAFLLVLIITMGLFFSRKMQFMWMAFGIVEVVTFFYFTYLQSVRWRNIPPKRLERKLFNTAFIIRAVYVFFIYYFYQAKTGEPFEFQVADATGYHGEALWILDLLRDGSLDYYFNNYLKGYSDSGWPLLLSVIYFFSFNSLIIARLVNALLSAWMVVLIYRLANRNFGEYAARISAIMAMLLPNFIYYTGLHLKETVMTFLLVAFAERADKLIRSRRYITRNTIMVIFLGVSLFFFRTVLAGAAWFSLFSALLLTSNKILPSARRYVYVAWFIAAAFFVFSGTILTEVERYWVDRDTNLDSQMTNFALREGGNKLAQYGSQSLFVPVILLAPFPTLVETDQPNANMVSGNLFTRNVYAFFVIIALWVLLVRKELTKHILILVILLSYLFILSASGFAMSERFHLPALPFLLILAGYGVTVMNKKYTSLYIPYLLFIAIIIIGWNWFKLAGRGVV